MIRIYPKIRNAYNDGGHMTQRSMPQYHQSRIVWSWSELHLLVIGYERLSNYGELMFVVYRSVATLFFIEREKLDTASLATHATTRLHPFWTTALISLGLNCTSVVLILNSCYLLQVCLIMLYMEIFSGRLWQNNTANESMNYDGDMNGPTSQHYDTLGPFQYVIPIHGCHGIV